MIRLNFRFHHDCPFGRLSRDFPGVPFSLWVNWRTEYIELGTRDEEVAAAMRKRLRSEFKTDYARFRPPRTDDGVSCLVVRYPEYPKTSIPALLDRSSVVLLYPIEFQHGWESYRTIVLENRRLPELIRRLAELGTVEVVQKRTLHTSTALASMLVPWDDILSGLTPRQKRALLQAIESGYYEVPRRVGITDIVNGSGISRTTFGQHIQKAEGKLMRAIAPFLSLDVHSSDPAGEDPLTRRVPLPGFAHPQVVALPRGAGEAA